MGHGSQMKIIKKKTYGEYYYEYGGECVTAHNNKLYIKPGNDTKINIICQESGTILKTINTNVYTDIYNRRYKIMFRENELFITRNCKFMDNKHLMIINNNYDIYANENKICLYEKNTLYKKDNKINIPCDDELISKFTPIDEMIVDVNTFSTPESIIQNASNCTKRPIVHFLELEVPRVSNCTKRPIVHFLELEVPCVSNCTIKYITATDDKIYACIEQHNMKDKIITYNIHKNKIQRRRKHK
jgi:hypothetical protein